MTSHLQFDFKTQLDELSPDCKTSKWWMRFALARRHRTQTPNTAEFVYIFFFNWKGNTRLLTRLKKKQNKLWQKNERVSRRRLQEKNERLCVLLGSLLFVIKRVFEGGIKGGAVMNFGREWEIWPQKMESEGVSEWEMDAFHSCTIAKWCGESASARAAVFHLPSSTPLEFNFLSRFFRQPRAGITCTGILRPQRHI
jgi:hypothetical protein